MGRTDRHRRLVLDDVNDGLRDRRATCCEQCGVTSGNGSTHDGSIAKHFPMSSHSCCRFRERATRERHHARNTVFDTANG